MTGWPEGAGRVVVDRAVSTMDLARETAPTAWVMARDQTGGRGRQGRVWRHHPGNLAASLVMQMTDGPAQAALRSFVASLALADALAMVGVAPERLALKWPNDVLLDGGKVAGILLEGAGDRLILGVGVNLAHAPPSDGAPFAPVAVGAGVPEEFLTGLAAQFARWDGILQAEGFAPIRAAWLSRAARLGEVIHATTPKGRISGVFETVDADGLLVLGTPNGPERIAAADIAF